MNFPLTNQFLHLYEPPGTRTRYDTPQVIGRVRAAVAPRQAGRHSDVCRRTPVRSRSAAG